MARSIDRGGVNPIHAEFERAEYRRDRVRVFLPAPGELPAGAADGPGAKPYRRDMDVAVPQFPQFPKASRRRLGALLCSTSAWMTFASKKLEVAGARGRGQARRLDRGRRIWHVARSRRSDARSSGRSSRVGYPS